MPLSLLLPVPHHTIAHLTICPHVHVVIRGSLQVDGRWTETNVLVNVVVLVLEFDFFERSSGSGVFFLIDVTRGQTGKIRDCCEKNEQT